MLKDEWTDTVVFIYHTVSKMGKQKDQSESYDKGQIAIL